MSPRCAALLAAVALLGCLCHAAEAKSSSPDHKAPWWQVNWAVLAFNGVTIFMGSLLAYFIRRESKRPILQAVAPMLAVTPEVGPGDALQAERELLKEMMTKVAIGGLLQFPSMILFFNIALLRGRYDGPDADPVLHYFMKALPASILAAKVVYASWWQYRQLKAVEKMLSDEDRGAGAPGFEELKVVLDGVMKQPRWWWLPCFAAWIPILLIGIPEVVDPDFDATTAGNADGMLNREQELKYGNAWCQMPVPYVGAFMATLGLPAALQVSICVSVFVQAYYLITMVCGFHECLVRDWHVPKKRYRVFADLAHVADLSNLMLLSEAFLRLRQGEAEDRPPDRVHGFVAKTVFETLPASWLQVSLLALSWRNDPKDPTSQITTLFSVITSLASMMKALGTAIPHFGHQLVVLRGRGYKGFHRIILCNLIFVPVTVLAVLACCVRVGGVFYCEHHILNLLPLHCVEVEEFSNVSCWP